VPAELTVSLGARSYAICLRPLAALGAEVSARLGAQGRAVLFTNDVVAPLYADAAEGSLVGAGWSVDRVVIPDGEAHKTLDTWRGGVERLLDLGLDRHAVVVALGGGVTGDIAGFVAASTLRGLRVVQVPTTLLSMVDSSVGGKTGVNTRHGKNLVGAFHQPRLVHVDVSTLDTLDAAELRCGLGEVVKHAVLADPDFFDWLGQNAERVLRRERHALQHVVTRCCAIKAEVVAADERESGRRALLNLGHTIGHALEAVLGYGALRHGEAVGIGMVAEARFAVARGAAAPELPARIEALLLRLGLPTAWPGVSPDALIRAARMDKKRSRGRILLTIPYQIGDVRLEPVAPEELITAARAVSPGTEVR